MPFEHEKGKLDNLYPPLIKKKKKIVKCDSELYVIMVYSTWGNCVPDNIQYVILCKFNHEDYNHVKI